MNTNDIQRPQHEEQPQREDANLVPREPHLGAEGAPNEIQAEALPQSAREPHLAPGSALPENQTNPYRTKRGTRAGRRKFFCGLHPHELRAHRRIAYRLYELANAPNDNYDNYEATLRKILAEAKRATQRRIIG